MHRRLSTILASTAAAGLLAAYAVAAPSGPAPEAEPTAAPMVAAGYAKAPGKKVSPTLFGMQPAVLTPTSSAAELGAVTPGNGIGTAFILSNGNEWSAVQPSGDVPPDTSYLVSVVDAARSQGLRDIHVILTGTPTWAAASLTPVRGEPSPGYASPPKNYVWWDTYVSAVVTALKGKATSYQVWSEANLPSRWKGTPGQLAELTRRANAIINQIDPRATVVAASTTARLGDLNRWYLPYLKELKKRSWPVDAFTAHLYPAGNGDPVARQKLLLAVKSTLRAAGAPSRPLWDGEVNYGVGGPSAAIKHRVLDNATGAAYVARTYLDSLRFGVSRVYWSAWTPKNSVYGVTMWPDYVGPRAQKTVYGWLAGKYWRGCVITKKKLVTCKVSSTTSPGSRVATIVWSEGKTVKIKVPKGVKRKQSASGSISTAKASRPSR
ncbi:MAG: hypothetical protein U0S36_08065 [Candidatus Nanopelagicales bacterium]